MHRGDVKRDFFFSKPSCPALALELSDITPVLVICGAKRSQAEPKLFDFSICSCHYLLQLHVPGAGVPVLPRPVGQEQGLLTPQSCVCLS